MLTHDALFEACLNDLGKKAPMQDKQLAVWQPLAVRDACRQSCGEISGA